MSTLIPRSPAVYLSKNWSALKYIQTCVYRHKMWNKLKLSTSPSTLTLGLNLIGYKRVNLIALLPLWTANSSVYNNCVNDK